MTEFSLESYKIGVTIKATLFLASKNNVFWEIFCELLRKHGVLCYAFIVIFNAQKKKKKLFDKGKKINPHPQRLFSV